MHPHLHSHPLQPRPHLEHRVHAPFYKTRWFLGVVVVFALVLIALRAVAPMFVQRYVNEQLADLRASKIPLQGSFDDPKVAVFPAMAPRPTIDRDVDKGDVQALKAGQVASDVKQSFLDRLLGDGSHRARRADKERQQDGRDKTDERSERDRAHDDPALRKSDARGRTQ